MSDDQEDRRRRLHEFATRLFRFINDRPGLTQKKLAERLGVSESTVSDWIQGRYFNYLTHFQKLCGALALSPDDRRELDTLLRGEPNTGVTEAPNKLYLKAPTEQRGYITRSKAKPTL